MLFGPTPEGFVGVRDSVSGCKWQWKCFGSPFWIDTGLRTEPLTSSMNRRDTTDKGMMWFVFGVQSGKKEITKNLIEMSS
jgi:hypothetical protein